MKGWEVCWTVEWEPSFIKPTLDFFLFIFFSCSSWRYAVVEPGIDSGKCPSLRCAGGQPAQIWRPSCFIKQESLKEEEAIVCSQGSMSAALPIEEPWALWAFKFQMPCPPSFYSNSVLCRSSAPLPASASPVPAQARELPAVGQHPFLFVL